MQKEEQVVPQGVRLLYSAPMPDTSNITASVEGDVVTITYAGGSLYIPAEALPTVTALTATVSAAIEPLAPVISNPEEPTLFDDLEATTPMENPYIQE